MISKAIRAMKFNRASDLCLMLLTIGESHSVLYLLLASLVGTIEHKREAKSAAMSNYKKHKTNSSSRTYVG